MNIATSGIFWRLQDVSKEGIFESEFHNIV